MDGMGEQAALAARASRGTHWPLSINGPKNNAKD